MQIEFTKEQYRVLLLLTCLGEWMINAHRVDTRDEDATELLNHILKYHKDFGETELVDPEPDKGRFYESKKMDEWMYHFVDEYDNEVFWDELIERLAERDFLKRYGENGIRKMTTEERLNKFDEFEEKYSCEFENSGLENLNITMDPFKKQLKVIS